MSGGPAELTVYCIRDRRVFLENRTKYWRMTVCSANLTIFPIHSVNLESEVGPDRVQC